MLRFTNIRNAKKDYDENWAIVRSWNDGRDWIKWIPALSPSYELFRKYLKLREAGKWDSIAFNEVYVPQFLKELKARPRTEEAFNYLTVLDKQGKTISLMCFCPDETLCHRSIVAGILGGLGANIKTDTGDSYSHFYEAYLKV